MLPDALRFEGRVLFLSEDPDKVARQLQGEDLDLEEAQPLRAQAVLQAQQAAIAAWLKDEASASARITAPTFIVNGDHDAMVATSNSFELLQRIPGATLNHVGHAARSGPSSTAVARRASSGESPAWTSSR